MNTDIRVSVSFPSHPKTVKLTKKLGPQGPLSFIYLLIFAGQNKPTGRLEGMDEEDIAIAAQWPKDPKTFVDALVSVKYLERENRTLIIHDWKDHNPYAVHSPQRIEKAKKAAQARWGNQQAKECPEHNQALPLALDSNAPSPAPIPSPTPDPIPKEVKAPAEPDNPPVDNSCPEKTPFEETEQNPIPPFEAFNNPEPEEKSNGNGNGRDDELIALIKKAAQVYPKFNSMAFYQSNYKNREFVILALKRLIEYESLHDGKKVTVPILYCNWVLRAETGNYNERQFQKDAEQNKITPGEAQSLGSIFKAMADKAGGLPQ